MKCSLVIIAVSPARFVAKAMPAPAPPAGSPAWGAIGPW